MFGVEHRAGLLFGIVAFSFVFIVAIGQILPDGVRSVAMMSYAFIASVASIAIGFMRKH